MLSRIGWLATLCCCAIHCDATTVVALVTKHGIVIGADGKVTQASNSISPSNGTLPNGQKVFVIQDRFAVYHGGMVSIRADILNAGKRVPVNIPYSVSRIIGDVKKEASPMFTLARIAESLRQKVILQFEGFDVLPQSGSFRPEHLPPPHTSITVFAVAGYDGQTPRIYEVGVDMDWKARVDASDSSAPHAVPGPTEELEYLYARFGSRNNRIVR